uniref:Uncharacterized protein n=1 Tax=Glossina pallidipes TaxID=7398 RepID=A0A1B0ABZ1_GLOPL
MADMIFDPPAAPIIIRTLPASSILATIVPLLIGGTAYKISLPNCIVIELTISALYDSKSSEVTILPKSSKSSATSLAKVGTCDYHRSSYKIDVISLRNYLKQVFYNSHGVEDNEYYEAINALIRHESNASTSLNRKHG